MAASRSDYRDRFLDAVDAVESGRRGAVSEDRWLAENYQGAFLSVVEGYLGYRHEAVVAETVLLLAAVRERAVYPRIREMSVKGADSVRMACAGYIKTMEDDDERIPKLFDRLEHSDGHEFDAAAARLAKIARAEDMGRVRRTYGQVQGPMRSKVRDVIERLILRNPSMEGTREFYLSVPVPPDEKAFDRFLTKSTEYLDVRYRASVFPKSTVSMSVYNNVLDALMKMRKRLYNESENLRYYDLDKADRFDELSDLVAWASEDLSKKTLLRDVRARIPAGPAVYWFIISV